MLLKADSSAMGLVEALDFDLFAGVTGVLLGIIAADSTILGDNFCFTSGRAFVSLGTQLKSV